VVARTLPQSPTLMLVALATALLQAAEFDTARALPANLIGLLIAVAGALGVARICRTASPESPSGTLELPAAAVWLLVALGLLPLGINATIRGLSGDALGGREVASLDDQWGAGVAYELQFCLCIRNLMLGLAACQSQPVCGKLAVLASVFLGLSAFLIQFNVFTSLLAAAYLCVGMWWLLAWYWEGIRAYTPARSSRELPRGISAAAILLVMIVSAVTLLWVREQKSVPRLAEWFWGSGGTSSYDPYARSGVHDGDQLTAGVKDAMTFGPVDTDLYLESDMPSLYDVFNDLFDTPLKPRTQVPAVALDPSAERRDCRDRVEDQTAGRELSIIRAPRETSHEQVEGRRTHVLFYVSGRVPLHLGLEVFTGWTGNALVTDPVLEEHAPPQFEKRQDTGWATLATGRVPSQLFPECSKHSLRLVNLRTRVIPSPPHLARVQFDRMDSAKFFQWGTQGLLQFAGDQLPRLTTLNFESYRTSPYLLERAEFDRGDSPPGSHLPRIHQLAKELAGDSHHGWAAVEAVCAGLRGRCQLDDAAGTPAESGNADTVLMFLDERRSGSNALFATSAALLLRDLGYRTRVVSGFYARGENYDPRSRQTAVYAEDVHFWPEIRLADGTWLPIEPTPGFEVLYLESTWLDAAAWMAARIGGWAWNQRWLLLGLILFSALLWRVRRVILAHGADLIWQVAAPRDPRARILAALRLLEFHSWLHGRPRPRGMPPSRWYLSQCRDLNPGQRHGIEEFASLCQWALYSGATSCPVADPSAQQSCQSMLLAYRRSVALPDIEALK